MDNYAKEIKMNRYKSVIAHYMRILAVMLLFGWPLFAMEKNKDAPQLSALTALVAKTHEDQKNAASLEPHSHPVTALCMDPQGFLFSGSSFGTIKIWQVASLGDVKEKVEILRKYLLGSASYLQKLPLDILLQVSKRVFCCDDFQYVTTLAGHKEELFGHKKEDITALCFDNDGALISCSSNFFNVWSKFNPYDPQTYECREEQTTADEILCMCISKAGLLIIGQKYGCIQIWQKKKSRDNLQAPAIDECIHHVCIHRLHHIHDFSSVAVNSKGDIFSVVAGRSITKWTMNAPTSYTPLNFMHVDTSPIGCLCIDQKDGLLAGRSTGSLTSWRQNNGQYEECTSKFQNCSVNFLTRDAKGRLYAGCGNGSIKIWEQTEAHDPDKFALVAVLVGHKAGVTAIVVDPSGRLFSASWDASIKVWCMAEQDNASSYECVASCERKDLK